MGWCVKSAFKSVFLYASHLFYIMLGHMCARTGCQKERVGSPALSLTLSSRAENVKSSAGAVHTFTSALFIPTLGFVKTDRLYSPCSHSLLLTTLNHSPTFPKTHMLRLRLLLSVSPLFTRALGNIYSVYNLRAHCRRPALRTGGDRISTGILKF
jgi:hypothetical protein